MRPIKETWADWCWLIASDCASHSSMAVSLVAMLMQSHSADAEIIAADDVSNYTVGASIPGLNGGTGFNAWTVASGSGNATVSTHADVVGTSFLIHQQGGGQTTYAVDRGFAAGALPINGNFSVDVSAPTPGNNHFAGLEFLTSDGDSGSLTVDHNTGFWLFDAQATAIAFSPNTIYSVEYERTSATAFTITINDTPIIFTTTNTAVNAIRFLSYGSPIGANNLQVVHLPEPSAGGSLAVGLAGVAWVCGRRRVSSRTRVNA